MANWRQSLQFHPRVARNIRVKALSEVLVKGGRFLLVVAAARLLSLEEFGLYSLAFVFGNVLGNVSDLGLQMHMSREVAIGSEAPGLPLRQAIRAKARLSAATFLFGCALAAFYPRPDSVVTILVLATATALAQSWNELWNYFFRGIQSLAEEARLNILQMLVGTGLGIAALYRGFGPESIFVTGLIGALLTSAVALARMARLGHLRSTANELKAGKALRQALPIGIAILLSILYFRIDVFFLERMHGDLEVGSYGAAYRIMEAFLFVPAVFLAAIYPAFSEASARSIREMKVIQATSLRWLVLLAVLVVTGTLLFAPLGIRILYGSAYGESAAVLRMLAPALLFIFINYGLTHFIVALHGQRLTALFGGICVVLNVVLNWIFVPQYGAIGAAATTVATEATLFALCAIALWRRVSTDRHGFR